MAALARRVRLVLRLAAGTVAGLLALWYGAVRATPVVRRRKAARRRARP